MFNKHVKEDKAALSSFKRNLKQDELFTKKIIDKLLNIYKHCSLYCYNEINKFYLLCSFLKVISMNVNVKNKYFDLYFAIIYIAKKIYYEYMYMNIKQRTYACKLLGNSYEN